MMRENMERRFQVLSLTALTVAVVMGIARSQVRAGTVMKTESFDRDPGWTGVNNRVVPAEYPTVTQDFGYSRTNHAGTSPGEMGGLVTRASAPAYYGEKIGPLTLDDKLSASGTFAFTKT